MPTLKDILNEAKSQLTENSKLREAANERMRKITSQSKQAILLSHQNRLSEAKQQLENAKQLIAEVREIAKSYPALTYAGMLSDALQEHSEACIFIKLIEEDTFPSAAELGVPPVDYILGLADVIGELRRLSLDALREGDVAKGEKCLQVMDEIFVELEALDEAYMLVPMLRRKNDVSRRVIESTRADITQEVRRKALQDQLSAFEQRLAHKA
jgi:translin